MSPSQVYQHYKGGYYRIVALAKMEATGEDVVVYQSQRDGRIWVRPTDSWEQVLPDGQQRFTLVPPKG